MSIANKITRLQNAKSNIADAITSMGGVVKTGDGYEDFAKDIISISEIADIRFIDYNGDIVETWSLDELQSKTSLPEAPTHTGMVFDGWSMSLAELKTWNNKADIGAYYDTVSGQSEFDIIVNENTYTVAFKMVGNKDWGDGTPIDNLKTHTYKDPGKYTIKCDGTAIPADGSSTHVAGLNGASLTNSATFQITDIRFSSSVVSLGTYSFYKMAGLKTVSFSSTPLTTLSTTIFESCEDIKHITSPKFVGALPASFCRNCYSLESVAIPNTYTSAGTNVFSGCDSLKRLIFPEGMTTFAATIANASRQLIEVILPSSMTTLAASAFINDTALKRVEINSTALAKINDGTFETCRSLEAVIFTNPTAVVSLDNTGAFEGNPYYNKVVVPDSLYDSWIAASNWKTAAIKSRIIKKSLYDATTIHYQKLEYIESSGTQYISSRISQTFGTAISYEAEITPTALTGRIGGVGYTQIFISADYGFAVDTKSTTKAVFDGTIETVTTDDTVVLTKTWTSSSSYIGKKLRMFDLGDATDATYKCSMKCHSWKIWDANDVLIRNFIPCRRIEDGELGMFDLVSDLFFVNEGTGDFIAGPDIAGETFSRNEG